MQGKQAVLGRRDLEMNEISPASSHLDKLFSAIENDEMTLPAMPELAIKIQRMLDDFNVSAMQIVTAVSSDPVLAAQIIKSANSALYSGKPKVDKVMPAVSRIGYKSLRNIVITVTMNKLSVANHPVTKRYIADFWVHSREVAAISYVLSKNLKHLNPDQAMLAGLVHDIGTLPLCLFAEKNISDLDEETLNSLARRFRAKIGERLLVKWEFPEELTKIIVAHEDLQRDSGELLASYSDVVTVANMLNPSTVNLIDWYKITAVRKLWLDKETLQTFFEKFKNELAAAREILS
jgi:HD-like signal output (HDOD) protein